MQLAKMKSQACRAARRAALPARAAAPGRRARLAVRAQAPAGGPSAWVAERPAPPTAADEPLAPVPEVPSGGDPWEDPKWQQYKWTVYRGVAYDLTSFIERHPAGSWLIQLAIGRDCTALFESYHLRPEVAASRLRRLPVLDGFPVAAVPRSPYPNDSEVYNAIRERVRLEVFKGGDAKGAHRSGSEGAALAILGYAAAAYVAYAAAPSVLTGFLMGLGGAWIGLTIQHCGNHGAMSTNAAVNGLLGVCNDLVGGSSLMWRYHHQVSHHIHCNDEALDEDVFSAFPILRFDARLPRAWYHRFQHIYMWATFPLLTLVFQIGDIQALFDNRTVGATLYGATAWERATVVLGKAAHYALMLGVPLYLHGPAATLAAAIAYTCTQSVVLASTFAVSHNVPEAKPLDGGVPKATLYDTELAARDWGVQQLVTSANWGGVVGNFFTGGLNLQVEHHLFPAISFMHYPAISKIVADEAAKRGIPYAHYPTLPEILGRFVRYMREVGEAEQLPPGSAAAAKQLARL
ncbi:MAG: fatty acyl delta4 desaturase [Monoraphidium minutum]|nr:MAG: fatty acyl delta4 desaturase [Monoraphidium minutum]